MKRLHLVLGAARDAIVLVERAQASQSEYVTRSGLNHALDSCS
jgi:hypothetical protein